jgi:hypothetical protein
MLRPAARFVVNCAVLGALLAQPVALLVWIGAEHGGRGLWTFPWAAMWGATIGVVACLILRLVRAVYRRVVGAGTA